MRLQDAPRQTMLRIISANNVWDIGAIGFVCWFGQSEVFVTITDMTVRLKTVNPRVEVLDSCVLVDTITKTIKQETKIQ